VIFFFSENICNDWDPSADGDGTLSTFKLVIVGDATVGKTSLLSRFCLLPAEGAAKMRDDALVALPRSSATVGFDFSLRVARLGGRLVRLQLWDTAGQERFRTIVRAHFRRASAAVVAFSAEGVGRGWRAVLFFFFF
jgi:Ras-related protein Rab-1A